MAPPVLRYCHNLVRHPKYRFKTLSGIAVIILTWFQVQYLAPTYIIQNDIYASKDNANHSSPSQMEIQPTSTNAAKNQINLLIQNAPNKTQHRAPIASINDGGNELLNAVSDTEADEAPPVYKMAQKDILSMVPNVKVDTVSCAKLYANDENEIAKAEQWQNDHPKVAVADDSFVESAKNCGAFLQDRGYMMSSLTDVEENFPLAYSIVMYKDVEQTERILRAIYRPQNYYCIHVDQKAAREVKYGVQAIAKCFNNVFIPSKVASVGWGTFGVVEAEINCMEDLLNKSAKWKYFINYTGQEWPLKTNLELVKVLQAINGSNLVSGTHKRVDQTRIRWKDKIHLKPPPPTNVIMCKGPVHAAVTRGFVEFLFTQKGQAFLQWISTTKIPDETFFASLNHSPGYGVPGAYRGEPEMGELYPHWNRFKVWEHTWLDRKFGCKGKYKRLICNFGVGDLHNMKFDERMELVLNKLQLLYHPLTLDCLEEYLFNRTREEILGKTNFSTKAYKLYEVTWNHNPPYIIK